MGRRSSSVVPTIGFASGPGRGPDQLPSTAVRSAVKSTTIAYLKFVNPTYGVGVTVLEKVKQQIQKIRIGPIEYDAGKSELPSSAAKFLAEAAKKLNEDGKLDVRLCPHANAQDIAALGGEPSKEALEKGEFDKEVVDKMFLLGHDRAKRLKGALISEHKVEPGRVVICATEYDKNEKAKPRVELVF